MNKNEKKIISSKRRFFLKTAITGVAGVVTSSSANKQISQPNVDDKRAVKKGYDEHSAHVKAYYLAARF